MAADLTGAAPPVSPSASRYLEALYYIEQEGEQARPSRLAEWLGVAPPTVTQALARLERDGYVVVGRRRDVAFTERGRRAAATIVRRHRIVEVWLTQELGLDWAAADEEAQRIAAAFTDDVVERLHAALGRPSTCPHGNPIPGTPPLRRRLVNLTDVPPGAAVVVARISEVAERDAPQLLGFLYERRVLTGTPVDVVARSADVTTLEVSGRRVEIPTSIAVAIWVQPRHGAPGG